MVSDVSKSSKSNENKTLYKIKKLIPNDQGYILIVSMVTIRNNASDNKKNV